MWKRRLAVTIVSQLPEVNAEAIEVLDLARFLVTDFLVDRSHSATVVGFDGQPFLPPVALPPPRKPKRGFPWWWGIAALIFAWVYVPGLSEATPGVVVRGAQLERTTVVSGEPLQIRIWTRLGPTCTGVVHRSIIRDDRIIIEFPPYFSEYGLIEGQHTRTIPLPPLAPGNYAYQSQADYVCGDGREGVSYVGPLLFRVIPGNSG
jgi:hypothetical protein